MTMLKGKEVRYLTRQDVEALNITMAEFIDAMEMVYREKGRGNAIMPPKAPMHPRQYASITAMPGCIPALGASGVKVISGFTSNYAIGMDYIHGLYVLTCPETGAPLSVMDCVWLTGMRTGAVTGMTARHLARKNSENVTIIGCGMQGHVSLDALMCVLDELKEIYVTDVSDNTLNSYVECMSQKYPGLNIIPIHADGLEAAVRKSDIVITCVPSDVNPDFEVIQKEWLEKEGITVIPVDVGVSFKPEALEASFYDKIFVDDIRQYQHFREEDYALRCAENPPEIGKMLIGEAAGRQSDSDRILAINIGTGLADLGAAKYIYDRAVEADAGTILPL